jgi:hypothetical protein
MRGDPIEGEAVKRVGWYILNAIIMLSLLLCVATCVLWVRSYFRYDELTFRRAFAFSDHGSLVLFVWRAGDGYTLSPVWMGNRTAHVLTWPRTAAPPPARLSIPHTLLATYLLVPDALRLLLRWRRGQLERRAGLCPKCGYDLLRARRAPLISSAPCRTRDNGRGWRGFPRPPKIPERHFARRRAAR